MSTATTVDHRSIGEVLLEADFQARQLLLDVTGDDAPAMLRTWGEVVQSAGDLWSSLPRSVFAGPVDSATMQHLESMSQSQHRNQLSSNWPGAGPPDERLLNISENLQRAGELAAGPGRNVRPTTLPEYSDLHAARMRVMHTLYVSAHAVGLAVHQHIDGVRAATTEKSSARETRGIPRGRDALMRIASFEQLAGGYVGNRFSRVMAGQHQPPPWREGRLHQALVGWDVQAHRTLAVAPTTQDLHLIARTQATIATASTAILGAAATTGRLDGDIYGHRLAPALDTSQQAWTRVADRWGALSSRGDRSDPALVHAANEVRATVHEIAFDRTRWATPQTMAERVDLSEAAGAVQQAMFAAAELSCVHRDVADQEPGLTGPARTLAAWTRGTSGPDEASAALITPGDIHANRTVPIPDVVRRSLVDEAAQLVDATGIAMSACGALSDVAHQQVAQEQGCQCTPAKELDRVPGALERTPTSVRR